MPAWYPKDWKKVRSANSSASGGTPMYPEQFVRPMREELTRVGFRELRSPQEVDSALKNEKRTALVVVNSICGCAAGKARPAVAKALANSARPEVLLTVFAGQDAE